MDTIIIDHVHVDPSVFSRRFTCNIAACHGACCEAGDAGAALTTEEVRQLRTALPRIARSLPPEQKALVLKQPTKADRGFQRTPLLPGGRCAYATYQHGALACSIQQLESTGSIKMKKPVSCELYPLRRTIYRDYETLAFHDWDICEPAHRLGDQLGVPAFRFVSAALIRAYGEAFYATLEAKYEQLTNS